MPQTKAKLAELVKSAVVENDCTEIGCTTCGAATFRTRLHRFRGRHEGRGGGRGLGGVIDVDAGFRIDRQAIERVGRIVCAPCIERAHRSDRLHLEVQSLPAQAAGIGVQADAMVVAARLTGATANLRAGRYAVERGDWVQANPNATQALLRAVMEAQMWCEDPANRAEVAEICSRRRWIKCQLVSGAARSVSSPEIHI